LERVELTFDERFGTIHLKSNNLKSLEKTLERKIHETKGGEVVKRDERTKRVKIRMCFDSNVNIIRPEKEKGYNSRIKINEPVEIKNFINGIHKRCGFCNIVIKPVISKKTNYVRFEIVYADIFDEFTSDCGKIYNKLKPLDEIKITEKIVL
jgi:hypothetical protein